MKKQTFYYAFFLVGFLFIAGTGIAQAGKGVSLPDFSQTNNLPDFISSVYSFAITVVGIAVFIRILYAGFLMLTAAGNTSKWGDAKTKMTNALIGVILLLAAYLILYVINPDLVSNAFKFTIPGTPGGGAPAATEGANKAGPTTGQLGVSGMVGAGGVGLGSGKALSFFNLPTARAQEGIYTFTIKVTDRNGDTCRETYNIEVLPNIGGELPGALTGSSESGAGAGGGGNLVSPVNQTFSTILDKEAMIELARTKTHEEMVSMFGPGIEQFFGDNVKAEDIPASFGGSSYFAWALSLGGKGQEGNRVGSFVFHSGDWYKSEETSLPAGVSGPTTPEISNYEGMEVTGMWIEQDYLNLRAGDQASTRVRVWYSNDNQNFEQDSNVSVLVSNNQVATAEVDKQEGRIIIKGVGGGQTIITVHPVARGSDKSKDKSIKVKVVGEGVRVSSLSLTSTSVTLSANTSVKVSALVHLSDGSTNPGVEIFSSEPNLVGADADVNGVITISASSLPEGETANQSYQATLTVHPMLAGDDRSFDRVITVTVLPSEENKLPVPAAEPELPFYIFDLSSNRQLSELTPEQIEELNAYFSDNVGVMPSSFAPGSWMAWQLNLGDETPTSNNGLPLQAIIFGYQYQGGRYISAFKVPTSNAVGVKIQESPDTVRAITDSYDKVSNIFSYLTQGDKVAGFFINNLAPKVALKIGQNIAYKSFGYVLKVANTTLLPVGIVMTGVELVNWYNNHRRTQHYKEDDTKVANDMMAQIKLVTEIYNSNRALDAEQERKYHDAAVIIVNNIFNASAPYFKLQRSLDSQRGYLEGYIRSMDQTLAQRLSSASWPSKNILSRALSRALGKVRSLLFGNILGNNGNNYDSNIAALNANSYAKRSATGKYPASILNHVRDNLGLKRKLGTIRISNGVNVVNAQEENGGDIVQIIQSGGCVVNTMTLPDAIENVPYYAEIYVAGESPFLYEMEDGSLPRGLSIVAALEMPVLTIKNMTVQRTPPTAFKVGDTFRLELINGKPNSDVYIKWFKNGAPWFYPGVAHDTNGWSKYAKTDADGNWVNQAAFTSNEIGTWQEYAMVNGKISKVIEFQVLAPEVKIVVNTPAPGTTGANVPVAPVYSGGGGCSLTPYRCENKETGEITELTTEDEVRACSRNESGEDRLLYPECTYSSNSRAACAQYDFEARNCYDQIVKLRGEDGYVDTSNLPHSSDGSPADVPAGTLYTTDQYSGDVKLGGDNLLVRCRYSDQVAAVSCGEMSSGEYCLPDGRNAGWNETWCAGKTDASGKIINPSPAPSTSQPAGGVAPLPRGQAGETERTTLPPASEPTPIPRGGETGGRGR